MGRRRVAGTPVKQIVFSGTPEDDYGWLEEFESRHFKSGKLVKRIATSFDNPFIDPEYAEDLLDTLDEDEAQIYVYGKSGRIGSDYFFYSYNPERNDYPVEHDEDKLVHATLDLP